MSERMVDDSRGHVDGCSSESRSREMELSGFERDWVANGWRANFLSRTTTVLLIYHPTPDLLGTIHFFALADPAHPLADLRQRRRKIARRQDRHRRLRAAYPRRQALSGRDQVTWNIALALLTQALGWVRTRWRIRTSAAPRRAAPESARHLRNGSFRWRFPRQVHVNSNRGPASGTARISCLGSINSAAVVRARSAQV